MQAVCNALKSVDSSNALRLHNLLSADTISRFYLQSFYDIKHLAFHQQMNSKESYFN